MEAYFTSPGFSNLQMMWTNARPSQESARMAAVPIQRAVTSVAALMALSWAQIEPDAVVSVPVFPWVWPYWNDKVIIPGTYLDQHLYWRELVMQAFSYALAATYSYVAVTNTRTEFYSLMVCVYRTEMAWKLLVNCTAGCVSKRGRTIEGC